MEILTHWKIRSLIEIESTINIPPKGFFVKNESSIRLCYNSSNQIKYIYLPTVLDAAKFLNKYGFIDSYAHVNEELKMYRKTLITIIGDNDQPVQLEKMIPYTWNDISLNEAQVQTVAAIIEFEKAGKTMGKIVSMATSFLKIA